MLCQSIDPKEDHIMDRESDVFDPLMSVDDLNLFNDKILEESRVGQDEFHLYESSLVNYCLP
jgi:hypothetical protein